MEPSLPATLAATEQRKINSTHVNQEFTISIALPFSYHDKEARKRTYPTIYLLDAYYHLGTAGEATRFMAYCGPFGEGPFPETIIVGIDYTYDQAWPHSLNQFRANRFRDYTPIPDQAVESSRKKSLGLDSLTTGGAEQFHQFINRELIPLINTSYRTDTTDQLLYGHSLSGLFVLYALFRDPTLFQGYVSTSPSIWYGRKAILTTESDYAQTHTDLPANLYLSVGQQEESPTTRMVSNVFGLAAVLQSRNYKSLTLKYQAFEDRNHCEAMLPGFQSGLKWFFAK